MRLVVDIRPISQPSRKTVGGPRQDIQMTCLCNSRDFEKSIALMGKEHNMSQTTPTFRGFQRCDEHIVRSRKWANPWNKNGCSQMLLSDFFRMDRRYQQNFEPKKSSGGRHNDRRRKVTCKEATARRTEEHRRVDRVHSIRRTCEVTDIHDATCNWKNENMRRSWHGICMRCQRKLTEMVLIIWSFLSSLRLQGIEDLHRTRQKRPWLDSVTGLNLELSVLDIGGLGIKAILQNTLPSVRKSYQLINQLPTCCSLSICSACSLALLSSLSSCSLDSLFLRPPALSLLRVSRLVRMVSARPEHCNAASLSSRWVDCNCPKDLVPTL